MTAEAEGKPRKYTVYRKSVRKMCEEGGNG